MSNAIRYFKALSDETRLRLTYVLERYELSVNELVSILEMGQSRVSRPPQDPDRSGAAFLAAGTGCGCFILL